MEKTRPPEPSPKAVSHSILSRRSTEAKLFPRTGAEAKNLGGFGSLASGTTRDATPSIPGDLGTWHSKRGRRLRRPSLVSLVH